MEFIFRIYNCVRPFKLFLKCALLLTALCRRGIHSHSALERIIADWRVDEGTKSLFRICMCGRETLCLLYVQRYGDRMSELLLFLQHVCFKDLGDLNKDDRQRHIYLNTWSAENL